MKQKRTFLLLSVVAAILLMAVAYAAINNVNLNIASNVTVTPDQADFAIAFTNVNLSGTGASESSAQITGPTTGTISVNGLTTVGDELTITYNITNSSNGILGWIPLDEYSFTNSNPNYFDLSVGIENISLATSGFESGYYANGGTEKQGYVILPNETAQLVIKVKLIKTPIEEQTSNIGISLTVWPGEY